MVQIIRYPRKNTSGTCCIRYRFLIQAGVALIAYTEVMLPRNVRHRISVNAVRRDITPASVKGEAHRTLTQHNHLPPPHLHVCLIQMHCHLGLLQLLLLCVLTT